MNTFPRLQKPGPVNNMGRQRGVTMIEALISMFIFSVGALGMAAMQLTVLSASGDSQQRTVAIWKAQELADRIRSNPALAQNYIDRINNSSFATIGVDSAAGVIACGTGVYAAPTTRCADVPTATGAACTADDDKVNFDIWEVFCDPNTGAAAAGTGIGEGSTALTNLEVVLRQNLDSVEGNTDLTLALEWVSREGEAVEGITNADNSAVNVATDLCGRQDVNVDSRLDVYCMRFRP